MDGEKYIEIIRPKMSNRRFVHSLNVAKEAVKLCDKYGGDREKAYTAGILHDIMKEADPNFQLQILSDNGIMLDMVSQGAKKLWHAKSGAAYCKYILGIDDQDIINAISYHTTARAGMSQLEKIIYLADYIGEDRDYPGVEKMRAAVNRSMFDGMDFSLEFSIIDLVKRKKPVHPDTVAAFNELFLKKENGGKYVG